MGPLLQGQPRLLHVLPDPLPAHEAVQSGVPLSAGLVDGGVLVQHVDQRQLVPLADLVVVHIMSGRHLEGAGPEVPVHVLVRDHRHDSPGHGHPHLPAHEAAESLVLWMHTHRRVAQDGLRTRRGHGDELLAALVVRQHVLEQVQRARLFRVVHLQVAHGRLQVWTPVHQVRPAVDQPFVVQLDEGLRHGGAHRGLQGESLPAPVSRGTESSHLSSDVAALFLFPSPHPAKEFFSTQRSSCLAIRQ
mmetsp:Transcript_19821/g.27270  ORF Transcript_19821/g.27270 Transcript_19821/m.27270 type:complete len:246 (+) Transcript_19821:2615-3352(+)